MSVEHWTPAKKHLECRSEPTSLPPRNRPEIWCRVALNARSIALRDWLPEVGSAGPVKSESRNSEAGSDGRRDRHIQTEKFHRLGAHSYGAVARTTTGFYSTAANPMVRARFAKVS